MGENRVVMLSKEQFEIDKILIEAVNKLRETVKEPYYFSFQCFKSGGGRSHIGNQGADFRTLVESIASSLANEAAINAKHIAEFSGADQAEIARSLLALASVGLSEAISQAQGNVGRPE